MAEIMARASRDFTTTGAFQGVYHHRHAGYAPDRLGRTLYQIFHGVAAPVFLPYARDVEAMLRYLVDDHPQGWQSINAILKCDCAWERAMRPTPQRTAYCYCVLEPKVAKTQRFVSARATERDFRQAMFGYVLDARTNHMHVLRGRHSKRS